MTGLQMLDNILKMQKKSKISAIVFVDNPSEDLINSYSNIGVTEFLSKPISLTVLQKKFEELVSSVR